MAAGPKSDIAQNAQVPIPALAGVAAQLILTLAVIAVLGIEDRVAFGRHFALFLPAAFIIHALLPLRFRLPFFVCCTLGLILLIFKIASGLWFLGVAFALIGVCHLPCRLGWRLLVLFAIAAGLAAVHAGWIEVTNRLGQIIPGLAAIFMFRLGLYLFELEHEKQPVGWWHRLAYFFLLPNPVFTLFPVVDYRAFLRTYYDQPPIAIYQKGVLWMARGALHLVLYRLVTNYLSPPADEVTSLGSLSVFLVSSYLIYLRISGLFHLIVGMLCLFGFNLPETHRFYLLASGFNDYWQRINIYWKDFMTKVVYYPVFARVKGMGTTAAVLVSTAVVFFATWLLHAYQSFWMRADARMPMFENWGLFVVDALFWGSFGVLVMINSWFALRRKPAPKSLKPKAVDWSTPRALRRALQIGAMLVLMCLLWSLWQSPSVGEWLSVLSRARVASGREVLAMLGVAAGGLALGVLAQYLHYRGLDPLPLRPSPSRSRLTVVGTMAALLAFGIYHQHQGFKGRLGEVADAMRGLDVRPEAQILRERGYYEGLLTPQDDYARLLRGESGALKARGRIERPDDFPEDAERWKRTGDLRVAAYAPNAEGLTVGVPWRTNEWGMRDRSYSKEKPPGVYRIAMMGASYTMGRGVGAEEDYESQLERVLNRDGAASKPVEVLNFAASNYTLLENAYVADRVIPAFQPDALFLVAHGIERKRTCRKLVQVALRRKAELSYDYLKEVVVRARLDARLSDDENLRRLEPMGDELVAWSYRTMVEACRRDGIVPVWILLPTSDRVSRVETDFAAEAPLAEAAGFRVLAIEDPYRGKPLDEVVLNRWDSHPNPSSHRDIALQLFATLHKRQDTLQLGLTLNRPADDE